MKGKKGERQKNRLFFEESSKKLGLKKSIFFFRIPYMVQGGPSCLVVALM